SNRIFPHGCVILARLNYGLSVCNTTFMPEIKKNKKIFFTLIFMIEAFVLNDTIRGFLKDIECVCVIVIEEYSILKRKELACHFFLRIGYRNFLQK
ncbi:MAG: hypothetical protein RSD64_02250, partial [Christensenellaceae bacterium]